MTFGETTPFRRPGGIGSLNGRPVARIGYGAMQLEYGDDRSAFAVLRRAVELGVNHIDTAEFYAAGFVNMRIRAALHPYPEGLVLVSKIGATSDVNGEWGLRPAQRPAEMRAEVETNLRTLGLERLDVVNFYPMGRNPDIPDEQRVDFDDQLAELVDLRDAGLIGGFGLSHVDAGQLRHAMPADVACVQNSYSLVDRSSEPVLGVCREFDIAWVPYFPLGSGVPDLPKVVDLPAVREVASLLGVSAAQVGLAWLLATGPHALLIPGTRSIEHLEENIAAGDVVLDEGALDLLAGPR
ncbi:aldo/keto reductase [Actinomadura madurae]|uniref:aldo/keto reductase n=1 Tax=Actinomadura madurae TaxID=1993 RepID=UPI0020D24ADC|nr:aldo/keto reductase [Actinomadura madurae]MCP9953558.1 aldo/keto reductase [Actinomadura madurae]MCP9970315.1 aldo/keto reductase [Actinomadura madurae]MCP9982792.1 aldo/keto reductase [Actinomadura madurae]MCQ0005659.1 aldo/keto reductase [Actinomadura madurae]MCQ0019027.1 aldo/keto reductase [Actinomadura madurae]